jgi:hypothetical protein
MAQRSGELGVGTRRFDSTPFDALSIYRGRQRLFVSRGPIRIRRDSKERRGSL